METRDHVVDGVDDVLTRLAGVTGFRELRFDARCPTGVRGTPPLLHLIADNEAAIVAVTARYVEYLSTRPRKLASAYDRVRPTPALAPWLRILAQLREDPGRYRYVDAAALLKHAVGLGQTFPGRPVKLAYLWRDLHRRAEMYGFAFEGEAPYPLRNFDLANRVAVVGAPNQL